MELARLSQQADRDVICAHWANTKAKRPTGYTVVLRDVLAVREGRLLLEDKREALPGPGERTPTMLLQAKYGLIPFTGSADIKSDLIDRALSQNTYATPARRAGFRSTGAACSDSVLQYC